MLSIVYLRDVSSRRSLRSYGGENALKPTQWCNIQNSLFQRTWMVQRPSPIDLFLFWLKVWRAGHGTRCEGNIDLSMILGTNVSGK